MCREKLTIGDSKLLSEDAKNFGCCVLADQDPRKGSKIVPEKIRSGGNEIL